MKNKAYWIDLVERYFNAETTLEEEKALRRFLATSEAQSEEFEEIRAVMSYLAVGKKQYKSVQKRSSWRLGNSSYWWAAAVVALLFMLPWNDWLPKQEDVCIAYVGGNELQNTEQVMQLMRKSVQQVYAEESRNDVELQLKDMFKTIELK